MALSNATETGYPPHPHGSAGQHANAVAVFYCEMALDALEDAVRAIGDDDIAARCAAVSLATEAVTSLYLALDAQECATAPLFSGPYYEAILTRLVHINLRNDAGATGEAIGMLERLRAACAQSEAPEPAAAAGRVALTQHL